MSKLLLCLPSLMLLVACSVENTEITPSFNREGEELQVTVTTYETSEELNDYVRDPSLGLQGQALYNNIDNECDIKLVKKRHVVVDDEYALTLGHELMHCLYGDYHR